MRDERGVVAIIFALAVVVLAPMILGLFDVYTATEQRAKLQDAVDAAALYAARSSAQTDAEINTLAGKALLANLHLVRGSTLTSSDFHLTDNNTKVVGSASVTPVALAPGFWSPHPVSVNTEVIRSSKNVEVALVLDITGSMSGTKISDLRTAAQSLVDIVVRTQQTPFYSKVAVVPWSMGVNPGTYGDAARGAVVGTKAVTAYSSWYSGTQKTISGATRASPVVVTATSHGFANGNTVLITGVSGMTQINGTPYVVANKTTNTFQLQGINGSAFTAYSSGGKVTKCVRTDCSAQFTSTAHGYNVNDYIYINNPSGTALRDIVGIVRSKAANTFNLFFASGPTAAYASGTTAYCTTYGCEYMRFTNGDSTAVKIFQKTSCVSERFLANVNTDVAPSTTPVGFNYAADGDNLVAGTTVNTPNPCISHTIIPLSSDRTAIKAAIGLLDDGGSTAGQTGVAWGWYMVSPTFGAIFPAASRPAAYNSPDTMKAVVVMTDGALNTTYCNGVIAQDSLSGSGSIKDHINCNGNNGSTFTQAAALCENMKTANIVVYTVGFQITGDTTATNFVNGCATDPDHVYLPTSGTALKDAFKAIGADINSLRLSH
ncbi:TadE/TadG family type IV pilus assembly protein [Phenylobacterium sp.]|uniref:TadE/TadG family type IV pilus assembly protein n=1 Tax=Phenylobacterium sp. TaxID=1871053 RepID=UPI0027369DE5|nr:TadE/TadG family type IV pilus assembly protein [Phenylobacterium sp.]MDP3659601.1 ubiquitin-activating E1 FCCH domain-containing protein [Phenylobacterium sp.]